MTTDTLAKPQITETKVDDKGQELGIVLINGHKYWRPVVRVACLTLGGTTLTMLASELGHITTWIEFDTDEVYTINFKYMLKREFEALGDFDGF